MKYIFTPYQAALDAKLVTELTTRRINNDKSTVILHDRDYDNFKPMIKVDDGETVTERYAETLKEKADALGATITSQEEALQEITKPEWQEREEE